MAARAASLCVAASLLIAIAVVVLAPQGLAGAGSTDDEAYYTPLARRLLAGQSLIEGSGRRIVWYPPGYPVILAGVLWTSEKTAIPSRILLTTLSVGGMCATTLLVFLIANRFWGVPGGVLSALVWATYPLALYFLKQPISEMPFLVALLSAVYCVVGAAQEREVAVWRVALCGVLIGIAMLIRPIAIGLGVVIAALIFVSRIRRRAVLAAVLVAANIATIAPWELAVYAKLGRFVPLSANGPASIQDGLTFAAATKPYRHGTWVPARAREVMRQFDREIEPFTTGTLAGMLAAAAAADPLGVAELVAIKAARSWYATDSQRFEGLLFVLQAIYIALIAWATYRAWQAGGIPRRAAIGAWTIAGYFWAMSIVGLSIARYMVPAMGVLFVLLPAVAGRSAGVRRRAPIHA